MSITFLSIFRGTIRATIPLYPLRCLVSACILHTLRNETHIFRLTTPARIMEKTVVKSAAIGR